MIYPDDQEYQQAGLKVYGSVKESRSGIADRACAARMVKSSTSSKALRQWIQTNLRGR